MTDKVTKLVDQVAELTVLELSELVKELQEKLGVSATPQVVPQSGTPAGQVPVADEEAGGGTVIMTAAGDNKIAVIKALREINPNLGLQEAKAMTENLPAEIIKDGKTEDAKSTADKLKAAGATVEVK